MADIRTSSMGGTPFGTTNDRPSNPSIGQTFFNGTLGVQEIYTSSGWLPATGANDFNVTLSGAVTTATFTKEYFAGAYTIASALADSTYDIYIYSTDGTQVGYTKSPSLTATGNFNKIVVIGGTTGDLLSFSYKTTFTATVTSSQVTAGPFITSLTPATLASTGSTTTVTGGNFATDVEIVFIGSDNVERSAKTVVRNSATSLTVTRPDTLPQAYEPYSVKATNPGITSPTGSNLHILSNAVDAGSSPTWTTSGALTAFKKGAAYTYSLSASDADSAITYAIASGALPSGLSLDTSTGVVSGTPTVNTGTPYSFVISATDNGGNTTNSSTLTLSQTVPDAPIVGTVTVSGTTATIPFTAPTYTGTSTITTYTATSDTGGLTGTLSQAGSGSITVTGLQGGVSYTFTVTATNSSGTSISSSASNSVSPPYVYTGTGSVQSFTMPSGKTSATFKIWGAGGTSYGGTGGTGGYTTGTFTLTAGRTYNVYVGKTGNQRTGGWPGGGNAASGGTNSAAGGGGGYSGIQDSTNNVYLAIAGAGGGAAGNMTGGKGGGTTGESISGGYGTQGGGTQTAGGVAGTSIDGRSQDGSYLTGGNASSPQSGGHSPSGGGGAGYYGGSGGATGGGALTAAPGGSGYVNTSYTSNGTTIQGVGTDADQGTAGNANSDGKVIIYVN